MPSHALVSSPLLELTNVRQKTSAAMTPGPDGRPDGRDRDRQAVEGVTNVRQAVKGELREDDERGPTSLDKDNLMLYVSKLRLFVCMCVYVCMYVCMYV